MRCSNCNKFVSHKLADPEIESLEISDDGEQVTVQVRIHLDCDECSEEMAESTFDLEEDISEEIEKHGGGEGCEFSVEEGPCTETTDTEGMRRGRKTYYGFELTAIVTCKPPAGDSWTHEVKFQDRVQASSMDVL